MLTKRYKLVRVKEDHASDEFDNYPAILDTETNKIAPFRQLSQSLLNTLDLLNDGYASPDTLCWDNGRGCSWSDWGGEDEYED